MKFEITGNVAYLYENVFFTREELELLGYQYISIDTLKSIHNSKLESGLECYPLFLKYNENEEFEIDIEDIENIENCFFNIEKFENCFFKEEDDKGIILNVSSYNVYSFGSNYCISKETENSLMTGIKSAIKLTLDNASINDREISNLYREQVINKGKKLIPNQRDSKPE